MALIDINLKPSKHQLNWFGLLFFTFFGLLGTILFFGFDARGGAYVIWAVAAALTLVYYAVPPFRRPLYLGWMYVVLPVGWAISHLLLAFIYFLLITPLGWALRLSGHDTMQRNSNPDAKTYWNEHRTGAHPSRYFKQF